MFRAKCLGDLHRPSVSWPKYGLHCVSHHHQYILAGKQTSICLIMLPSFSGAWPLRPVYTSQVHLFLSLPDFFPPTCFLNEPLARSLMMDLVVLTKFLVWVFLRHHTMQPWLAMKIRQAPNSRDPSASTHQVLGSKACTTMLSCFYFQKRKLRNSKRFNTGCFCYEKRGFSHLAGHLIW